MSNLSYLSKEKIQLIQKTLQKSIEYLNSCIVIECSGSILDVPELADDFFQDIVLLKSLGINPVIVHGDMEKLESIVTRLNINLPSISGVKITSQDSIDVIEMIISTYVNKKIVTGINQAGGLAIGISGKDTNFIRAKKLRLSKSNPSSNIEKIFELSHMGEVVTIDPEIIVLLEDSDLIPVVSSIAYSEQKETLQINSAELASEIAAAILAKKLIMIADNLSINENGIAIQQLSTAEASRLIATNQIPVNISERLAFAIKALDKNVETVSFADGKQRHSLLTALFSQGLLSSTELVHTQI